ncbi:MAG: hypothetical protein ACFFD8_06475 [Candidatus Thorarchaeota archaeon]
MSIPLIPPFSPHYWGRAETLLKEHDYCAICLRLIKRKAELRKVCVGSTEFVAHGFCLNKLRRLACDIDGMTRPMPTLLPPLTLNEFLLAKRPSTAAEILCCIAFFFQESSSPECLLTVALVEDTLQYSPFKINDIPRVLLTATDSLSYFQRQEVNNREVFILTEKGRRVVKQLPK